ncbi:hypothetical protein [Embleya sp. NPDC001921]
MRNHGPKPFRPSPKCLSQKLCESRRIRAAAPHALPVGRLRERTFDSYTTAVDWTDADHVAHALRVFETRLRWVDRDSRAAWL